MNIILNEKENQTANKPPIEWSASRINSANYCRRRYFLKYILKDKELNLSYYLRGRLIHGIIETFWDKIGEVNEIKRNKHGKITSKIKYSNPEEFLEYAQNQWVRMMKQEENSKSKREIIWNYGGEMWQIRNSYLPSVCIPLFNKLTEEGRPLESELEFSFILGHRKFKGFIDELRLRDGNIIIRDYKTESPWMKGMKLSGNPQLTLYCVAVSALCNNDDKFAKRMGLENIGEIKQFMGDSIFISEKIKPEFYMIDTLTKDSKTVTNMPQLIYPTERTDKDFNELLRFLGDIEHTQKEFLGAKIKTIPATERGKKCDYCDMKISCLKRLEEELKASDSGFVDEKGQAYFSFVAPYSRKERKIKHRVDVNTKRFKWKPKKI